MLWRSLVSLYNSWFSYIKYHFISVFKGKIMRLVISFSLQYFHLFNQLKIFVLPHLFRTFQTLTHNSCSTHRNRNCRFELLILGDICGIFAAHGRLVNKHYFCVYSRTTINRRGITATKHRKNIKNKIVFFFRANL